ncbi:meiotic recombination protein SPO11-like [Styela clava]
MSNFSRDFWENLDAQTREDYFRYPGPKHDEIVTDREVLAKIEDCIVRLLNDVRHLQQPSLQFRSRSTWQNVEYIPGVGLQVKKDCTVSRISLCRNNSCYKFGLCLKVLSMIYKLLQSNQTATKRDLFYNDPKLFKSQTTLDHLVDDIGCMLGVPRHMLHVVATSKGCIAGDLKLICEDGEIIDCSESASGVSVPVQIHSVTSVLSKTAKFILVIEKDATFQRLLSENLPTILSCIIITGKGVPDVNTRLLTRILSDRLHLPVLGLFDSDPHGIEIMCVYRFGSLSLAYDSCNLAVRNMKWIGLLPTDVKRLNLPKQCLLPFSGTDERKCRDLMKRPYMASHPEILKQVKAMEEFKHKAEIQSLSHISSTFLGDVYLPLKVKQGEWI